MKRIDHVLINVENLEKSVNDFQEMGFTVFYGSTKKNCHHAMIYFSDSSFIELIDQSKFPSFFKFLAKKGILNYFGVFLKRISTYLISKNQFLDYAIFTTDIDSYYKKNKDSKRSKLLKLKRKNHLKNLTKWSLVVFDQTNLPFVMSEYEPNELPEKNADLHKNKILGIKEINLTIKGSVKDYCSKFKDYFEDVNIDDNKIRIRNSVISISKSDKYEIKSISLFSNSKTEIPQLMDYGINIDV